MYRDPPPPYRAWRETPASSHLVLLIEEKL